MVVVCMLVAWVVTLVSWGVVLVAAGEAPRAPDTASSTSPRAPSSAAPYRYTSGHAGSDGSSGYHWEPNADCAKGRSCHLHPITADEAGKLVVDVVARSHPDMTEVHLHGGCVRSGSEPGVDPAGWTCATRGRSGRAVVEVEAHASGFAVDESAP